MDISMRMQSAIKTFILSESSSTFSPWKIRLSTSSTCFRSPLLSGMFENRITFDTTLSDTSQKSIMTDIEHVVVRLGFQRLRNVLRF
ncbi:hypothetical protein NY2A_B712R [Paramecium bursaria Chlorella virus NY2A]|uniref:Uncharacterized protein B712R n=1 Tax=Paramecium bursaria Chlorella virus NY2A TaxID=46021 RepID=A7IVV6_PBCVN|nr:hypothetical protein NY2A_b081R [Paramecium bursaria Chlorella virus NY2A]YP_001497575.1 hypothetical protein NY2A_b379R [Paramecium bursaria Chlorella virus NY2A]YP_001497908.1 hypothetical protein NY2A_B712R [Paramecium bursaria Chlorella virus NY2A]ABT14480.1 hypothetical protein NY2A_b081R [Paramecium bursaria Chlorella virus NY2A]ABT14778.1 hypothetical protein NY2A_b379R [Paramecium bursaria Chlorella virus NY2A]ABT15111.1 hypothetical protein NY2A_B712R [Paramecium bursaria Chlorella